MGKKKIKEPTPLGDKCKKCGEMTAITHPKMREAWCPRCGAWYE